MSTGLRPSDGKRTAASPVGRWLLLLVALFAFSLQAIVSQTHRHPLQLAASGPIVAKQDGGARLTSPGAPADSPANCPICQELAHAGVYLPPAPFVFTAPLRIIASPTAVAALFLSLRSRPIGWRSRAPPLQLQA